MSLLRVVSAKEAPRLWKLALVLQTTPHCVSTPPPSPRLPPPPQGFSVAWWKNKHNTHHAVPNELDGDEAVDPDIDTLPFFAWDAAQLANASPSVRSKAAVQGKSLPQGSTGN